MKKRSIFGAFLSLSVLTLFGCSGGGGGGTTSTPTDLGTTSISGVAAKGPIKDGIVVAYSIDSQGVKTEIGRSGATDSSGNYSISFPTASKPAGAVLVEVTGGTFDDEASGTLGVKSVPLQAAVSSLADGPNKIAITPMTHMAVKQVEGIGSGAFTPQEIDDANKQVGSLFKVEDIIKSQPFDSTKGPRAGATDDEKGYSAALGVFSQLCDKRRGASKLEDALGTIIDDLGKELNDNGGFLPTTVSELNDATTTFNDSGKNKGGVTPTPIVITGGVLQLATTGTLPLNTLIDGIDITVKIPAGVTFGFDAATGAPADGVLVPSSNASTGSFSSSKYDPATGTLHMVLVNVKPGIAVGEFAHLEFSLASGTALPDKAAFAVTAIKINGSGPSGFNDLLAGGINVVPLSVAGF